MKEINEKLDTIILRNTQECDLDFVINAERDSYNSQFVDQWPREQHLDAMVSKDILHLLFEDEDLNKPVGYAIVAGLENRNKSIELKRIVITDKGRGVGRKAIRLVKKMAFEKFKTHRLWLDVREKNRLAQNLYKSEGFIEEGILRQCVLCKEGYESLVLMSILEEEYFKDRISNNNCE